MLALLACASCDNVLGLSNVQPADATIADAPPPVVSLTWQLLTSTPADTIAFQAIAGATVSVGAFDGELTTATPDMLGSIELPYALATQPYRIVFQVPGDPVIHEVQRPAQDTAPHITVPLFGALPRVPPPASCGYVFHVSFPSMPPPLPWSCSGFACGVALDAVITGVWYHGQTTYIPQNKTTEFQPPSMLPMSGLPGTPMTANGDLGMVFQFDNVTSPRRVASYAQASLDMMSSGPTSTMVTAAVPANTTTFVFRSDDAAALARIGTALGPTLMNKPNSTTVPATVGAIGAVVAGVIPDARMPSMSSPALVAGGLDESVLIVLNDQEFAQLSGVGIQGSFPNPFTALDLPTQPSRPPALRYRVFQTRPAAANGLPMLSTGFQVVTTDLASLIQFDAGLATNVSFGNLLTSDDTPVTLAAPFADLKFTVESAQAPTTYDCAVTSYNVDLVNGVLVPIRTIIVTAAAGGGETTVREPTADFVRGNRYAVGIVCRDVYPAAAAGDYRQVAQYPQNESQLFPGTFIVQ